MTSLRGWKSQRKFYGALFENKQHFGFHICWMKSCYVHDSMCKGLYNLKVMDKVNVRKVLVFASLSLAFSQWSRWDQCIGHHHCHFGTSCRHSLLLLCWLCCYIIMYIIYIIYIYMWYVVRCHTPQTCRECVKRIRLRLRGGSSWLQKSKS